MIVGTRCLQNVIVALTHLLFGQISLFNPHLGYALGIYHCHALKLLLFSGILRLGLFKCRFRWLLRARFCGVFRGGVILDRFSELDLGGRRQLLFHCGVVRTESLLRAPTVFRSCGYFTANRMLLMILSDLLSCGK